MVTLAQSSPGDRSARAPQSKTATVILVSVRRVLESYESSVIQEWWPDSRRGHRCGRARTKARSKETTSAGGGLRPSSLGAEPLRTATVLQLASPKIAPPCNLRKPRTSTCAGGLQFPAQVQRHQALFSLGALCV